MLARSTVDIKPRDATSTTGTSVLVLLLAIVVVVDCRIKERNGHTHMSLEPINMAT